MFPVLTSKEMREWDAYSIQKSKIPSLHLMEEAGKGLAHIVTSRFSKSKRGIILCGTGNNGGDGFVAARILGRKGYKVTVAVIGDAGDFSPDAKINFKKLNPVLIKNPGELHSITCDYIVDALFGTGLSRPVAGIHREAIRWLNGQSAEVISADIPSGLNADTGRPMGLAVKATVTVTFGAPKRGFFEGAGPDYVGELAVCDIGLDPSYLQKIRPSIFYLEAGDFRLFLNPRKKTSHKGNFGHVFTVASSENKIGAGVLCAHAALKIGAGLSTLVLPRNAFSHIDPKALEIMWEPTGKKGDGFFKKGHLKPALNTLQKASVVALGPGIGTKPATQDFVYGLLKQLEVPIIADADALNAIALNPGILRKRKALTILTPHPAEMGRLADISTKKVQESRVEVARTFAERYGCVVILKGSRSVTALPDGRVFINPTGNPGMANAGQGDVLTGILAGLISQFPESYPFNLLFGPFIHGFTGDLLAKKKRVILAGELMESFKLWL